MKSATMPFFARLAAGLLAFTALPAAVCLPTAAFAQKTQVEPGAVLKNLSIGVGKSVMIDLPRDATEIFIGDPTVANAVVRSPRKLFLLALANGQTTIYAMDAAGKQIAVIDVSAGRNIEQLAEILKAALPNSALTVRTVNDTVILTGSVDNANDAQQATDIADGFTGGGQLSEKNGVTTRTAKGKVINSITIRGRDQVMVKVTIAEIQRNILKTLGVTSSTASGSWGSFATANTPTLNGGQGLGANILKLGSTSLGATLEAFERSGVGRILAEPNVTAVSGEAAKFTAGGTIPVPAGTSCSTGANNQNICIAAFEYKPYGVTLNMTPVCSPKGASSCGSPPK